MKKLNKMIYALAALPLMLTACVEEVLREPGTPDLEDCYGVYFKELTKDQKNVEFDPSEPTQMTFTILRPNSEDAADLPAITVHPILDCPVLPNGEKVFQLSEISFEQGQTEAQFTVDFPDAELGVPYTCNLSIDDPAYVSIYSKNPSVIEFTVTRVKWNPVVGANGEKTGKYRDDLFFSLFGLAPETDIAIEERADKPGYYRIHNLYSAPYLAENLAPLFQAPAPTPEDYIAEGVVSDAVTIIDATDPKRVIWQHGSLGFNFGPFGGVDLGVGIPFFTVPMYVGSYCVENDKLAGGLGEEPVTPDKSVYGTMVDGVIKFPPKGLYMGIEVTLNANFAGLTRIMLPGAKDIDYSLEAESELTEDGVLPFMVKKGLNVEAVKYAVLEGSLPAKEIKANAEKIAAGKLEATDLVFNEENVSETGLTLEKTGVYTIVLAGLDKGNLVSSEGLEICYVAAGEKVPVVINAGALVSDKYAGEGATAEDAVEIYINGKDLVNVQYGLYELNDFINRQEDVLANLIQKEPLPAEDLQLANSTGFSKVIGKLKSGVDYILLVYADNGYEDKFVTATALTEGEHDPFISSYYLSNLLPIQDLNAICGNHACLSGPVKNRKYNGNVTVFNIGMHPQYGNIIGINGFWTPLLKDSGLTVKEGTDLTCFCDMGDGYLILFPGINPLTLTDSEGKSVYGFATADYGRYGTYPYPLMLILGLTEDGHLALVDSEQNRDVVGCTDKMSLVAYGSNPPNPRAPLSGPLATISNLLMVTPEELPDEYKPEETPAPAPAPAPTLAELSKYSLQNSYMILNQKITTAKMRERLEKSLAAADHLSKGVVMDIEPEHEYRPVAAKSVALPEGQYDFNAGKKVIGKLIMK